MIGVYRVLSLGAGVQSSCCLLLYWKEYDYVIFSDTHNEEDGTYWYIEKFLKPFCKEKGVEWVTVDEKDGMSVLEGAAANGQPEHFFHQRQCTKNHKIFPIHRWMRKNLKPKPTYKNPVMVDIGFSIDESHRVNHSKYTPKYIEHNYPLIDARLSRRDCNEIIRKHGWPLPVKSGCKFCPFAGWKNMRKYASENPEQFRELLRIEEADPYYPKRTIFRGKTLRSLLGNKTLEECIGDKEWVEKVDDDADGELGSCDSGYCNDI